MLFEILINFHAIFRYQFLSTLDNKLLNDYTITADGILTIIHSHQNKKESEMGFEVGGIFGLIVLIADIWAIVSTFQSPATTGKKVIWIVLFKRSR
jgi:hypothetical protein